MKDNDLINLIATQLEAGSAALGFNYVVLQKEQPTQQGIPTAPTIFFEKLFDNAFGYAKADYTDNATNAYLMDETETQMMESTFQISALVPQNPADLTIPTASDVANAMRGFMTSRATVRLWNSVDVSVLRVSQVRNPYIEDDRHRFEATPSFDIIVTHSRTNVGQVGKITTVTGNDLQVPQS